MAPLGAEWAVARQDWRTPSGMGSGEKARTVRRVRRDSWKAAARRWDSAGVGRGMGGLVIGYWELGMRNGEV